MTGSEASTPEAITSADAIVIGAGFSGLYAAYALTEAGLRVQGVEGGAGPGGTWYWNRYPGARTDSLAHIYCYTFSRALRDEWDWSERYPGQPEVLAYLEHVADRFDLRRHFRFGEWVTQARYDETANVWSVTTDSGAVLTATYLVTAVGVLSAVNWPDIPGLRDFGGTLVHTARWPHEGLDVAGKRVGVIGAGSSGVQVVPELARDAAEVVLFQRTPNYVVPSQNRPLTDTERRQAREQHDSIHSQIRNHVFSHPFEPVAPSAKAADPAERTKIFEDGWNTGGFGYLMATFADVAVEMESNELAAEFVREKIRSIVNDRVTAETLTPRGYPYASKRPPAGNSYYETFNLPHVRVVDILTSPIERVTGTGVEVAGEEYPVDVLVVATGFDASTGGLLRLNIQGRGGQSLGDAWADGPRTYLGMTTPGYPNMFMVLGPQEPFANIPTCIEENVNWIRDAIVHARSHAVETFEASTEAAEAWSEEVEAVGNQSIARFGTAVNSWMNGANVDGKPRGYIFYFGGANTYFDRCDSVARAGYPGFRVGAAPRREVPIG